jgi:hypothetical protein
MEVKVHDTAFIAANRAAASRLGNEDPLDLLVAPCDRFAHAPLTTPALSGLPRRIEVEGDTPVTLAVTNLRRADLSRRAAPLLQQRDRRLNRR